MGVEEWSWVLSGESVMPYRTGGNRKRREERLRRLPTTKSKQTTNCTRLVLILTRTILLQNRESVCVRACVCVCVCKYAYGAWQWPAMLCDLSYMCTISHMT